MAYKGSFYYDEDYDMDVDYHNTFEYSDDENLPTFGFNEVMSCGYMVIKQLLSQFIYLLGVNFVYRLIRQTASLPEFLKHLSSSLLGYLSTFIFFSTGNYYVCVLMLLSYCYLKFIQYFGFKQPGFLIIIAQIVTIFICEIIEWDSMVWQHMRGSALIISMKAISIAFDVSSNKISTLPPIYEYSAYILSPANLILGPFVSFNNHKNYSRSYRIPLKLIAQILFNSILSISFIFLSTCFLNYLISDNARFFITYRDALIFRTSHYFICFMSVATLLLSGIDQRSNSSVLGYQITRPFDIEFPRSLVPVVISWNIPIHQWIKTYVFENIKQYGKFNAIILTYLISASLHGLNFQLAAVLLSIGVFSYVEFRLRNLLAEILDACVNANKCTIDVKTGVCLTKGHENTLKVYWVKLINFIFAIFTMVLLAYLGVLLDTSVDHGNDDDFRLFANLKRWSELNYFGHIIVLVWYLIYLILLR